MVVSNIHVAVIANLVIEFSSFPRRAGAPFGRLLQSYTAPWDTMVPRDIAFLYDSVSLCGPIKTHRCIYTPFCFYYVKFESLMLGNLRGGQTLCCIWDPFANNVRTDHSYRLQYLRIYSCMYANIQRYPCTTFTVIAFRMDP